MVEKLKGEGFIDPKMPYTLVLEKHVRFFFKGCRKRFPHVSWPFFRFLFWWKTSICIKWEIQHPYGANGTSPCDLLSEPACNQTIHLKLSKVKRVKYPFDPCTAFNNTLKHRIL